MQPSIISVTMTFWVYRILGQNIKPKRSAKSYSLTQMKLNTSTPDTTLELLPSIALSFAQAVYDYITIQVSGRPIELSLFINRMFLTGNYFLNTRGFTPNKLGHFTFFSFYT